MLSKASFQERSTLQGAYITRVGFLLTLSTLGWIQGFRLYLYASLLHTAGFFVAFRVPNASHVWTLSTLVVGCLSYFYASGWGCHRDKMHGSLLAILSGRLVMSLHPPCVVLWLSRAACRYVLVTFFFCFLFSFSMKRKLLSFLLICFLQLWAWHFGATTWFAWLMRG